MDFERLRLYTKARIGLGHKSPAIPTKEWLLFSRDHASAVDALTIAWDEQSTKGLKTLRLNTKVADRREYLQRPDLGRKLSDDSKHKLLNITKKTEPSILVMASNGLSSLAVNNHLRPFLTTLLSLCIEQNLKISYDIMLIPNARVAVIDDLGEILKPSIGISIIGERPGLLAPDSLACYLTYEPRLGRSDAERNCISNIRPPHGLSYQEAAFKLIFLIKEALRKKLSGVMLKDISDEPWLQS